MRYAPIWVLLVAACSHEIERRPTIVAAQIGPSGATVDVKERVDIEHPCGVGHYAGYILTFGLLWVIDSVMESKFGHRDCPTTETIYEHPSRHVLPVATSEPRRKVGQAPEPCLFAAPEEGCVTDRSDHALVPPWSPKDLFVYAVAPDRSKVVAYRPPTGPCSIISVGDAREIAIGACDKVRFADHRTIVVSSFRGDARVVDVETGVELGSGQPNWLGAGLAAVWRERSLDIVERSGWRAIASVELCGAISEPGALVLIGRREIIEIRPGAEPVRIPLAVEVAHVLDARGDLALVQLRGTAAAPVVAVVRLSTGEAVARAPR